MSKELTIAEQLKEKYHKCEEVTNYKEMLEAGADMLVAGSDIFKNNAIQDNINSFK